MADITGTGASFTTSAQGEGIGKVTGDVGQPAVPPSLTFDCTERGILYKERS
jgi:hypothetical protein